MLEGIPEKSETGRSVYDISQETSQDWWEVEALYDLCFAPGREALSSYRLRDGVPAVAELCLIARDEHGILAGRYGIGRSRWMKHLRFYWGLLRFTPHAKAKV